MWLGSLLLVFLWRRQPLVFIQKSSVRAPRGGSRPASSLFHTSAAAGAAKNKTRRRTEVPGTARSRAYASATGVDGWARFNAKLLLLVSLWDARFDLCFELRGANFSWRAFRSQILILLT